MTQLKLQTFTDSDVSFLMEYAQVISNVAKALNKIQWEDQANVKSLLPTVMATIMKLKEVKFKHHLYCSPLVAMILAGIMKRFELLLEGLECQLPAAFHPKFSLFKLVQYNNSQVTRVTNAMETIIETALMVTNEEGNSTTDNEDRKMISSATSLGHGSLKSKVQNWI